MRALLLVLVLLLASCVAADAAVTAAGGQRYITGSAAVRVDDGYEHWTYQPCTEGVAPNVVPAHVNRFRMHHSLTLSSMLVPARRIDLWHTNTTTDTITFRLYNSGNADSVTIISAAIANWTLPLYADSVAVRPWRTSAAGDWNVVTYFKR